MNKYKQSFILSVFALFISIGKIQGQKVFIDENIGYWYNVKNEIHINHNVFLAEDSTHLFLEISFNEGHLFDNYDYVYEVHDSYHKLDILSADTLNIEDHIIAIKSGKIVVDIHRKLENKADIIVFKVINKKTGIDYVYDIPTIEDYNFSTDGLLLYDEDGGMPYLSSFANTQQVLQLKSIQAFNGPIYGFYYAQNFDEGVPPMVIEEQATSKGLKIDSVFSIQPNEAFSLSAEGLYFFQKDSSSANGIGVRVQDPYYPLVKTIDKVIEPLIYISTSTETEAIRNAENPRVEFERYWLKLTKIPALATATVQKYYQRVEEANYLFTNFEEGWKSDMGMIYIVYGPPNDVYKSEEIIDWVYNRDLTMPVVRFSFYKVKNVFTDHHYTLLRKKNYEKHWFKSVELWRNGKK